MMENRRQQALYEQLRKVAMAEKGVLEEAFEEYSDKDPGESDEQGGAEPVPGVPGEGDALMPAIQDDEPVILGFSQTDWAFLPDHMPVKEVAKLSLELVTRGDINGK